MGFGVIVVWVSLENELFCFLCKKQRRQFTIHVSGPGDHRVNNVRTGMTAAVDVRGKDRLNSLVEA